MTRKELEIRETAVLSGYRDCNAEKCVDYVMKLYERNVNKKLYRFRPPQKHDIEALLKSQIYLCRPRVYTDNNDCVWIDDIQALVEYEINVLNKKKYEVYNGFFTQGKYEEIVESIMNKPRYKEIKDIVRNMCLIACITDKMSDYMWEKYTCDYEGVCLEYDFEEVLYAIKKLKIRFMPIRYVDDRAKTKDIQFGPEEYAKSSPEELMERKYILSCLTKNRIPFSKESEWRIMSESTNLPINENGKLFEFIKPHKVYLGKNIGRNEWFESEIRNASGKLGIEICEM